MKSKIMKSKYPSHQPKQQREYYQKNKEKIKKRKREWNKKNKEKIKQFALNYDKLHPNGRKEIRNKWKKNFLEKNGINYNRAYYQKNKEKILVSTRKWEKANRKKVNDNRKQSRSSKVAVRKYCFSSVAILCVDAIESNGKRIPITKEGLEFLRSVVGFDPYKWRKSPKERQTYTNKRNKEYFKKYGIGYYAKRYQDKQKKLNIDYKRYARRKAYKIEVPVLKRKRRK